MYYRYAHVTKRVKELGNALCVDVFDRPKDYHASLGEYRFPLLTIHVDIDKKYPSYHIYPHCYEGVTLIASELFRVKSFLLERNFLGRLDDYDLITSGLL